MENNELTIAGIVSWLYHHPQGWFLMGFLLYFGFLAGSHLAHLIFKSWDEYAYKQGAYFLRDQKILAANIAFLVLTVSFWIICRKDGEWLSWWFTNGFLVCGSLGILLLGFFFGNAYVRRDEENIAILQQEMAASPTFFLRKEVRRIKRDGQLLLSGLGLFLVLIGYLIFTMTTSVSIVPIKYIAIISLLLTFPHARQYWSRRNIWAKTGIFIIEISAQVGVTVAINDLMVDPHLLLGLVFLSVGCMFFFDLVPFLLREWRFKRKIDTEREFV